MTDYCGACGEPLVQLPSGSRVACHPDAAMYWSPHEPQQIDLRGFRQLTGLTVRQQRCIHPEQPHPPLHLYRRPS